MHGVPVFLASVSLEDRDHRTVATGNWTPAQLAQGTRILRQALEGVGDPKRERLFRMNITLCMHRACTASEVAGLPQSWQSGLWAMAGGAVEILWQNVPDTPSCRPCEFPHHRVVDPRRPDLWIPDDCGCCDPCAARAALRL
jgi:hypothetical protein